MRNILEDVCTEEETVAGKAVFEGGFKFSASDTRKKFYSTASAV